MYWTAFPDESTANAYASTKSLIGKFATKEECDRHLIQFTVWLEIIDMLASN